MTQEATQPPVAVRKITPPDFDNVAGVLARAFDTDPVMNFLVRQDSRRPQALRQMMRMAITEFTYPHGGETYVGENFEGAALWNPPGRIPHGLLFTLRTIPAMVSIAGLSRLPRIGGAFQMLEKKHPKTPHYYLMVLGVEPALQGKGVGTTLARHMLERVDREHMPAYLESSNVRNNPLYERLGFKITEEVKLPNGGPSAWLMWRDPQ
jgi:ribosomal protein S18 acetylase RimI-like enzyme